MEKVKDKINNLNFNFIFTPRSLTRLSGLNFIYK